MPKESSARRFLVMSLSPLLHFFISLLLRSSSLTNNSQHAPSVNMGKDAVPEFSAQTLPTGRAPSDRTFKPNPQSEVSRQGNNPKISKETWRFAGGTIGSATSANVHTGYGPGSG